MTASRVALVFVALLGVCTPLAHAEGNWHSEQALRKIFSHSYGQAICRPVDCEDELGYVLDGVRPGKRTVKTTVSVDELSGVTLHNNANVPLSVFMVATAYTLDELHGMFEAIVAYNQSPGIGATERIKLNVMLSELEVLQGLRVDKTLFFDTVEVNNLALANDIWVQDMAEVASFRFKGSFLNRPGIIDIQKLGDLATVPHLFAQQYNWYHLVAPGLEADDQGNFGGNIEATPDDMLVIGSTAADALKHTFFRLGYLDRSAILDTSWLEVGHVDEIVSFLPAPQTKLGYVALVASPLRALDLLGRIPAAERESMLRSLVERAYLLYPLYPNGFDVDDHEGCEELVVKLGGLHAHLSGSLTDQTVQAAAIDQCNRECARVIDGVVDEIRHAVYKRYGSEVSLEVVEIPALFEYNDAGKAVALTPSMVNLVSLRHILVMADPFLDIFRSVTDTELQKIGYSAHFVPSLTFHFLEGQFHCSSCVLRHPSRYVHPRYAKHRHL